MVPPWFQACKNWKIACYLTTSIANIHLFYLPLFPGALEGIHYVKGTVFISHYLLQPSIKASCLWLIQKNLKGTVFVCGKRLQPCFFQGTYLFHRTKCINFCLQPFHSFIANVLIWQIYNINSSYPLIKIIFLGKHLQMFPLANVTFGTATFS